MTVSVDPARLRSMAGRIRATAGQLRSYALPEPGAPPSGWRSAAPVSAAYRAWADELSRIADGLDELSRRIVVVVETTEETDAEIATLLGRIAGD
jgi:uncharacterized protein YukE